MSLGETALTYITTDLMRDVLVLSSSALGFEDFTVQLGLHV